MHKEPDDPSGVDIADIATRFNVDEQSLQYATPSLLELCPFDRIPQACCGAPYRRWPDLQYNR